MQAKTVVQRRETLQDNKRSNAASYRTGKGKKHKVKGKNKVANLVSKVVTMETRIQI